MHLHLPPFAVVIAYVQVNCEADFYQNLDAKLCALVELFPVA